MAIIASPSVSGPNLSAISGSNLSATQPIQFVLTGDGSSTSFSQSLLFPGIGSFGMGLPISGSATLVPQQNSGLPPVWVRNTNYALNTIIAAPNGTLQKVTTAGKSFGTVWVANNSYSLNQVVLDSFGNSHIVTTAGQSGTSLPTNFTLNVQAGTITQDNGVTWQCQGPYPNFSSTTGNTTTDGSVTWTCQGPNTVTPGYDSPTATVSISGTTLTLNFSEALAAPGAQVTDAYGNVFTYKTWACAVTLNYTGSSILNNVSATWNSGTAQNTALLIPLNGAANILVPIITSGTITAGVLGFQASPDGQNWLTVFGTIPANFQPIAGWTLTAGNTAILFNVAGYTMFRVILTTAISGAGSVTVTAQEIATPTTTLTPVGLIGAYSTSAPAPSSGNAAPLQIGPNGSLIIQPYRRSQTKMVTGNIASTTAATLLAAQGAGIFADLFSLVLSLGGESTAAYIRCEISDGTNIYQFAFASEAVGTAGSGSQPMVWCPEVPIPATNANTAWTILLSAADATIYYVAQFVNQTANF